MGSAISPENRDPFFRITLKNAGDWCPVSEVREPLRLHLRGLRTQTGHHEEPAPPKKKAGQKGPGHASLVAAQYSQKSPKNNALFAIWLADLALNQPGANCHQVLSAGYTPRSTSSKWFMTASLHRQARIWSAARLRTRIEPRRVSKIPSALKT